MNHSQVVSFIWGVADLIRDTFKRGNHAAEVPGHRRADRTPSGKALRRDRGRAHSSQSGESTRSLKAVLSAGSLQEAEREEAGAETPEEEIDDAARYVATRFDSK